MFDCLRESAKFLDLIGFFMAGFSTFAILATVALTRSVKLGGVFEEDETVARYCFELRFSSKAGMKAVWFLVDKAGWFLLIGFVGFLLQIPAKMFV